MQRSVVLLCVFGCSSASTRAPSHEGSRTVIDRFSVRAGHLMVRDQRPGLPAPDQPIDFDRPPFITQGLGPDGGPVRYYNFDVQRDTPAKRYRFTHAGKREPLVGQADVVDTIPGDPGYSDLWQITWVEVPATFVPGSVTSAAELHDLPTAAAATIVDCPIVPRGSTAREGHGVQAAVVEDVWYRGERLTCLRFLPDLTVDRDRVPTSPIYVTFATEAGPSSGFRTEPSKPQTHNVVLSVPGDVDYSPLWSVHIYDRAEFDRVRDANTALAAHVVDRGPLVNCPVVSIGAR